MYAQIALFSPPYGTYTYALPDGFDAGIWQKGLRLAVPLGKRSKGPLRAGLILQLQEESGLPAGITCRDVVWPLERRPLINAELMATGCDLALRQGLYPGTVFGHVLPAPLRSTELKLVWNLDRGKEIHALSALAGLNREKYADLARAFCNGEAILARPGEDLAEKEICVLRVDPPWPLRPAARKQIGILDYLRENGPVIRRRLIRALGAGANAPLKKLVEAGYVRLERVECLNESEELLAPGMGKFQLTKDQKSAFDDLVEALANPGPQVRLLYGVTGSGKTAVYLELAKECLEAGRSLLFLAPEVALAHKLYRDVREFFSGISITFYHGYQPPLLRGEIFRRLAENQAPTIVVGTRSALFLPIWNIGCVIMDEEHDSSFKQDESLAYSAKEVAWHRITQSRGLLVLGSATPDIKSFHAAREGKLPVLYLPDRIGGSKLPPIELVKMEAPGGFAVSGQNLLSHDCEDALHQCMQKGEQAVILLNRRGYAPMIYCQDCKKILHCPHCAIGLAFHKSLGRLVCHYCGYSMPWPSPCPHCGGANHLAIGDGTEKLAESLETLAGKPVLRLDRDSARRPGKIEEILTSFARKESPFLVGTQMLSKGHHFPDVTLVIVADGDIGLNLPDYRAAERTFQLLIQSAGRAGRGSKAGRVFIQTRDTAHYCWQHIVSYDYESFYQDELARRKKNLYPPFIHLALLRISFDADETRGEEALKELGLGLKKEASRAGVRLLGPVPAPIKMLRGKKRYQCLIKCRDWNLARSLYFFASRHPLARYVQLFLDLDPVNML